MKKLFKNVVGLLGVLIAPVVLASPTLPSPEDIASKLSAQYGVMGGDYSENVDYYSDLANHLLNGGNRTVICTTKGSEEDDWNATSKSHGGIIHVVENGILRVEYLDDTTKEFVVTYITLGNVKKCSIVKL